MSCSGLCSPSALRQSHRAPLSNPGAPCRKSLFLKQQPSRRPVARSAACNSSGRKHEPTSKSQQYGSGQSDPFSISSCFSAVANGSLASALVAFGGGTGGGGFEGGDWGGSGGGSGSNSLYELAAADKEEEEEEEEEEEGEEDAEAEEDDGSDYEDSDDDLEADAGADEDVLGQNEFRVDEIVAEGLPVGEGVPTQEELFAALQCQPGFVCNKSDLSADLRGFMNWGVFQDVQARVAEGKDGKSKLIFTFIEQVLPTPKSVAFQPYRGSARLAMPDSEIEKAKRILLEEEGPLDAKKMFRVRNIVDNWYQKQGFTNCYVTHIDGMESGNLKVKVLEGKVNNVNIVQVDADGEPTRKKGNVPPHIIMREVPFKKGQLFKGDYLRKCLRDVFGLGHFESMSVNSKPSKRDDTRVDVELMLKERPMKTADLDLEWQLAPTPSGRPGLVTLVPGGSITFENGNLLGSGRQISATASTANFLQPSDDLGYQLSYRQPELRGPADAKRTEFNAVVFNTRKLSAVFAAGPGKEEVPAMFVDRTGAKLMISEQYSRNSKGTYGLVLEQVANYDDTGALAPQGTKPMITGEFDANGPPTSLSGSGRDALGFLQGNFTRDTTYYENGMLLGGRDVFQVDQGFGLGSTRPVFNRHRFSSTRFTPLGKAVPGSKEPRKVLVLHGRYGGCVGDLPPYDLFTLGGPFSVRGFNVGEVATTRFFLEGAAELRVPVKGRMLYAFAEHATDLGSSASVKGNPTQYFRRPGSGTSLGAGVKLGAARLEVASEGLAIPTQINVRFGERF